MIIKGIVPAIITPIKNNKIDETGVKKLVDHLIENGANGIFALGTTGEFYALNDNQKREMTDYTIKYVKGRVPVVIGVGDISTQKVIENIKSLNSKKVDAVSVIMPYFMTFSQNELINHYKSIAKSTTLPVILLRYYNFEFMVK